MSDNPGVIEMRRKHIVSLVAAVMVFIGAGQQLLTDRIEANAQSATQAPKFVMEPGWLKAPTKWTLGYLSSVSVDQDDHVWILQRPQGDDLWPLEDRGRMGPPVMEFDVDGNFLQGWGGPGAGYEWPQREHGIHVDYKGNVWIGGNYCAGRRYPGRMPVSDDHLLKFTRTGELLMQIGQRGGSLGNADIKNLALPSDAFVFPETNEVFVADGYVNHRIIVFDADTGLFKRMWGAFGNEPLDNIQCPPHRRPLQPLGEEGTVGPDQLDIVHAAKVSNDGHVYVADRQNNRVQVFTVKGEYVEQVFIGRGTPDRRTASSLAFSADPSQQFLYVAGNQRIAVLDRKTLEVLGTFGEDGIHHHITVDSKGNIYSARLGGGRFAGQGPGRDLEKWVLQP